MMEKKIRRKLRILLAAITLATAVIFFFLIQYNAHVTEETASQMGSIYMLEMMYQTQDHFKSILQMKQQEALHVAQHSMTGSADDPREVLRENAETFGFDYLAFYDDSGNYETVMGESAWYRNFSSFMEKVKAGEEVSTTGYLTRSSEKYLVFGVPAEYEMESGAMCSVLLLGFNVEKLYDYIHIEELEQFGYNTRLDIILTNGSYILKQADITTTSYFEHILQYGSFMGMETEKGITQIEKAMAGGKGFSHTVTLGDITKHIYGAPVNNPEDWYFVLSMPQGATDALLTRQNNVKLIGFGVAGISIFLLSLLVFLIYSGMSYKQIRETEAAKNEAIIANKAKSTFLSNMSHDIRTPMNAVFGFASIAEENMKQGNTAAALDAISKMKRSTDYLRSLIGDVLDMSKIESGTLSLMPETVSFTRMAEMVDTISRVRAEMKHQTYLFTIRDVLHDEIACDRTRLHQILLNLIGNAVKFTPDGGEIRFEAWQEPSDKGEEFIRVCFLIRDNGIGISPDFISTIFESFSREESRVRKIEGTGLGLAISKKLVDMMGGSIRVESEEGRGSSFHLTVDLPKVFGAEIRRDEAAPTHAEAIRIIMAEDNDFNYEIAQVLLEGCGFKVSRAENGREAVSLYCASPESYDLILMDLRMPVLDGYQAAEQIRAFEWETGSSRPIPIYALSADVFEEDITRCAKVGMNGHISKPIDMNELLRKIKGV